MDCTIDPSEMVETEMDDTSTTGDSSAYEPPASLMTYLNDLDEQMLVMRQHLSKFEDVFLGMRRTMKHIDAVVEDVRRLGRSQEESRRLMMASLINRGPVLPSFNETTTPTISAAPSAPAKDSLTSANNTSSENFQSPRLPQGYPFTYSFLPVDPSGQYVRQFGGRSIPPGNPGSGERICPDTETIDALEAFAKLKISKPLSPDKLKMFLDDVRSKHKVDDIVRSYTADKVGLIEQLRCLLDILKARCQQYRFQSGSRNNNFDSRLISRIEKLITTLRN